MISSEAVTLQTLGASIPTDDVAHRIQLENRVFLDALDKQTKTFLTIPEHSLRKSPVRDIFKGHSQETIGKRKDSHGIDSLPYAFITIGNLS